MQKSTLCPSARENSLDSVIFGIAAGTVEEPRVAYLPEIQPVTDELLALAEPVTPTEVFRFAASCAEDKCAHFDGVNCRLAQRIVRGLPEVTDTLPPCRVRQSCRWWLQEGKAACFRCPQVVTDDYNPSEIMTEVAEPVV
ncbi:MAG: nitrogen fixation protein [Microcystis sp. LE19-10.1B]|uniref:nitrogen fixation protein n=1 Tax=Microcystis sp. LE19-10.1B TaxID=3016428 RepID=UPI0022C684F1|nr:nitrogen fixation protein [Microcystis sp. LE19-10.1B]MCZ8028034.1 nitrogen fixation protein [Microcystis sp. LE19-10.1B]MCZ8363424.1 nitrogen fixation protein [Microcystis sp. LE19-251.1A]